MAKKKELHYGIIFILSIIVALIAHYFLLADTNLHPTLQAFISFLIFTVLMGFIVMFLEKNQKEVKK